MASKVLIVDDHPIFILGLVSLIANEPNLVVCGEALTENEAIKLFDTHAPDLIVMDLSLGSSSGLHLVKKIRSLDDKVKILVASMHDEQLYTERCLRAGADGYIGKQEASSKIIDAINDVLNGKIYLSKVVANQLLSRQLHGGKEEASVLPENNLSDREMEVFSLIGQGLGTKVIASKLNLSVKTIDTHKEHIKRKLNLSDNTKLVHRAVTWLLSEARVF